MIIENETGAKVGPGCRITVRDCEDGYEETFEIVGSQEADPMLGRISDESPLGRAAVGHVQGDTIVAKAPAGEMHYEIVKVEW